MNMFTMVIGRSMQQLWVVINSVKENWYPFISTPLPEETDEDN
jgi:hypothetical protein